jgi:hypothetical protein
MLNALRFVLLCLIALLLVNIVVGVFARETGGAEKVFLAALGVALLYASAFVRRLRAGPQTR